MNPTIELLKKHRSIRKFTAEPIPPELLNELFLAAQSAATSSFLQGTTIVRVKSPETRALIAESAGNQTYVKSAAEFLVMCADLKRAGNYCIKNGFAFEGQYTEQFIIATVDVALLAQNLVIAAESEGLGICYIGGIRNDPRRVTELLDLPLGVYPVFGLCLGYPDQDPEIKPRLPLSVIVKEETYNERGDEEDVRVYDEKIEKYYKQRLGGGHGITWSKQVSKLLGEKSRPHMRDYLNTQGFKFQ